MYDSLPLNAEARKVADSWDPAKDEAAGEQCRAYGAANIMRLPGRLHITWEDAEHAAHRHRRRHADTSAAVRTAAASPPGEPTWQGHSVAQWEFAAGGRGAARTGNLKVVTTNLRPGYVRKNGAPYSAKAVVTEFYDLNTMPNGDQWMTITTKVEDPVYFTRAVPDDHRLQEAARHGRLESHALLGPLTDASRCNALPLVGANGLSRVGATN